MYRGTTPTIGFQLPFECSYIGVLNIAFAQNDKVIFEKTLRDCELDGRIIAVRLTENETLSLNDRKELEIQLRVAIGNNKFASNIIKTTVGRILKEGVL